MAYWWPMARPKVHPTKILNLTTLLPWLTVARGLTARKERSLVAMGTEKLSLFEKWEGKLPEAIGWLNKMILIRWRKWDGISGERKATMKTHTVQLRVVCRMKAGEIARSSRACLAGTRV